MKGNNDYLRDLLLKIEENEHNIVSIPNISDADRKIIHHVQLLCDAGFMVQVSNRVTG